MLVTKTEFSVALTTRQIEFLSLFCNDIVPVAADSYRYKFRIGTEVQCPKKLYTFLAENVWARPLFRKDVEDYVAYMVPLLEPVSGTVERSYAYSAICGLADYASLERCLVHGDATLENFIDTPDRGIVPIDPGLPRGFCHRENDLGKILQYCLTYWPVLKNKGTVEKSRDRIATIASMGVVTGFTIASLLTHWLRIIKNADRHEPTVKEYGVAVAIPILVRELRGIIESNSMRHRWNPGRLYSLGVELLPRGN